MGGVFGVGGMAGQVQRHPEQLRADTIEHRPQRGRVTGGAKVRKQGFEAGGSIHATLFPRAAGDVTGIRSSTMARLQCSPQPVRQLQLRRAQFAMRTLDSWIQHLLADNRMLGMGHAQRRERADLGLGWLYYGLARVIQPATAVVIGSHRGFVPLVIGRALQDNGSGKVVFLDPSFVDPFWLDPAAVQQHFAAFGVTNIEHHCATTQEFVASAANRELNQLELLFVDGYHSYAQARFDFEAFEPRLASHGAALFHDSLRVRTSRIYGPDRAYEHRVCDLMAELRQQPRFQVFDLPHGDGLSMVRKVPVAAPPQP